MSESTRSVLQRYWGYASFRPLQEEIVDSVVEGRDTLALLPTGGGKSICFQVPAMAMEGICVVITPLIALMKDQVLHLKEKGIEAAAIYSGLHPNEVELAYNQAVFGRLKFLYVSPERLLTTQFLDAIRRMKVNLLAVDESHCISQWGYDFRPPYLRIAEIRPYIPSTPALALTATATAKVVDDIQLRLGFKQKNVFRSSFERKNLTYSVYHEVDKFGILFRKLSAVKEGSAIVYVRSRKKTQIIAEWLTSVGISSTFYHAGLDSRIRDVRQAQWMTGKVKVIVATNAFGMGIDKPDVRLVVHMDLPDSVEAYFQEAGRAGRDLKEAEAILLVSPADIKTLKDSLALSFPEMGRLKQIYQALGNYLCIPIGAGKDVAYPLVFTDFAKQYGFSPLEVFNTLKLLEKEGYLLLSESFEEPSKLCVKASRDDIYRFQVEFPQYNVLISYILRNMPGVLTDFVAFNEESMARKIGVTVDRLSVLLGELEKMNFLCFSRRNDTPQIRMLTEYMDVGNFGLSKENYYDRKKDAAERIQAMIDFVSNDEVCRSVQLLSYFNEKTRHACGRCDVCLNRIGHVLDNKTYSVVSNLLLNKLSSGSISIRDAIGFCESCTEEDVIDVIRWMLDNGIIFKDKEGNLHER